MVGTLSKIIWNYFEDIGFSVMEDIEGLKV